jgi:hypothetical protein
MKKVKIVEHCRKKKGKIALVVLELRRGEKGKGRPIYSVFAWPSGESRKKSQKLLEKIAYDQQLTIVDD